MKKLILVLTMLLTLGFSLQGVAAQTPDSSGAPLGEAMQAEGLESAYDRTYMMDFEALMASPSADMAEMDTAAMMRVVSITGMTFDSEDNAKNYVNDMKSQIEDAQESGEMPEGTEIRELEDGDIDKDGIVATMSMEDLGVNSAILVFVDGDQVFMIVAIDADVESAEAKVTDIAKYVVDADVENDEVTFNEDGTSTGGVFDRMPEAGNELVGDLTSVTDSVLQEAGE